MLINPYIYAPTTASEFIFTVDTTQAGSASDTFVLPLQNGATSMTVYWGDGNSDVITTYNQAELTHVYASSGTYQISCDGQFHGVYFAQSGDRLKVSSIDNWGTNQWGSMFYAFGGCSNMVGTYTDNPDASLCNNFSRAFSNCSLFNSPLTLDMSSCLNTSFMFGGSGLFNSNLTLTNASNITAMNHMFYACGSFNAELNIDDTSGVTNMGNMFNGCAFNQPLNFDTSSVTLMSSMFLYSPAFDQDLSGFNISSLTNAASMFLYSGFSTANYDLLLVSWQAQAHNNGVSFSAGNAKYNAGAPATAKAGLITDSWTITDGGPV
jgi:hypothetical protein